MNRFAGLEFKIDFKLIEAIFDTWEGSSGLGKHHMTNGFAIVQTLEIGKFGGDVFGFWSWGGSAEGKQKEETEKCELELHFCGCDVDVVVSLIVKIVDDVVMIRMR